MSYGFGFGFSKILKIFSQWGNNLLKNFTASVAQPYESIVITQYSGYVEIVAQNTTGNGAVYIDNLTNILLGEEYQLVFYFEKYSGSNPNILFVSDGENISGVRSNNASIASGTNRSILTVTSSRNNADLLIWNSNASSWLIRFYSIKKKVS